MECLFQHPTVQRAERILWKIKKTKPGRPFRLTGEAQYFLGREKVRSSAEGALRKGGAGGVETPLPVRKSAVIRPDEVVAG